MELYQKTPSGRAFWHTGLLIGGVLLAVLALSIVAGLLAGSEHTTLALLFVLGPALPFVFLFVTKRFDLAVLMLPLLALAVPLELSTGTETRLPAALLLVIALFGLWLLTMAVRHHWYFVPSLLNRPMLIFSAICCISLGWGILWRDPILIDAPKFIFVQVGSLVCILASLGAALLIGNFVRTQAQLKYIIVAFIGFGALMAITELFHINQRILNDRGLWGMWTVIPAYGLLIAQPKLHWYWRILLMGIIALTMYVTMIINSYWLSGWVPTVFAIYAATFLRSKKAFVLLLIIGAAAVYGSRDFFISVADDNINDGSLQRLSLWEQNWRVVSAHWLFGTGPAGYALYYMTYYRDDARSTHNNYLDIVAQFGFSGLLVWFWLAIAGVIEGWRLVRRAAPGFLRSLAIIATAGWIGAQASMFFGDWILPFAYNQGVGGYKYTVYSWLFLGTIISIRQLLSAAEQMSQLPMMEHV